MWGDCFECDEVRLKSKLSLFITPSLNWGKPSIKSLSMISGLISFPTIRLKLVAIHLSYIHVKFFSIASYQGVNDGLNFRVKQNDPDWEWSVIIFGNFQYCINFLTIYLLTKWIKSKYLDFDQYQPPEAPLIEAVECIKCKSTQMLVRCQFNKHASLASWYFC